MEALGLDSLAKDMDWSRYVGWTWFLWGNIYHYIFLSQDTSEMQEYFRFIIDDKISGFKVLYRGLTCSSMNFHSPDKVPS